MTTILAAVGLYDGVLVLSEALDVGSYGAPFTLDSENILVTGGDLSATVSVARGQNGTAPASHVAGTTLTAGWAGATDTITVEGVTTFAASTIVAPGATESSPGVATLAAQVPLYSGANPPNGQATIYTVGVAGGPAGGTYAYHLAIPSLAIAADTTALAFDATLADIVAALNVAAGNDVFAESGGNAQTTTNVVATVTVADNSLTGGTDPAPVADLVQAGLLLTEPDDPTLAAFWDQGPTGPLWRWIPGAGDPVWGAIGDLWSAEPSIILASDGATQPDLGSGGRIVTWYRRSYSAMGSRAIDVECFVFFGSDPVLGDGNYSLLLPDAPDEHGMAGVGDYDIVGSDPHISGPLLAFVDNEDVPRLKLYLTVPSVGGALQPIGASTFAWAANSEIHVRAHFFSSEGD